MSDPNAGQENSPLLNTFERLTAEEAAGSTSQLRALNQVISALSPLSDEVRQRVIEATGVFFGISLNVRRTLQPPDVAGPARSNAGNEVLGSFSEDRTISPKDFLLRKLPHTEVERVACLAFYLTHYRDNPHFKTIDISKLNTEAAQPKFGNAAQAVDNAAKMHYLVPASKGNKQLSASGELFVQNLPDREAARSAMASLRPRRRKKQITSAEDSGADE